MKPTDVIPPNNLHAEQCVLGCVMLDSSSLDRIIDLLSPKQFYSEIHGKIYTACLSLNEQKTPVDAVILADEMESRGQLTEVGGVAYFMEILETVPHASHVVHYAEMVLEKYRRRKAIEIGQLMISRAYDPVKSDTEFIEEAHDAAMRMAEMLHVKNTRPRPLADHVQELIDSLKRGEIPSMFWGISEVDTMIGGVVPGELVVVGARPSHGKAQPLTSKILTPTGFVSMGSLKIGMSIIGSSGMPTMVTGIFPQGEIEVYRVGFSDGTSCECCADHLWKTQTRNERRRGCEGSAKTLKEIAATITRNDSDSPNHSIPVIAAVEYSCSNESFPIHPYALGLLLGDGSFSSSISFNKPEKDISDRLSELLPVSDELIASGKRGAFRIRRKQRNNQKSDTCAAIESLGLTGKDSIEKFIPDLYSRSSIGNRLLLLQGLCDTDGHVVKEGTSIEYATSSEKMASQVVYLARGLGFIVNVSNRIPVYSSHGERKKGSKSWRIMIRIVGNLIPVSSKKHLARLKPKSMRHKKTIIAVDSIGKKDCQCITVNAVDRLYVTDDFIVTHNSAIGLQWLDEASRKGIASLMISEEMVAQNLASRTLTYMTSISVDDWRQEAEGIEAEKQIHFANRATVLVAEKCSTIGRIERTIERAVHSHGIRIVAVDYAQLVDGDGDTKEQRVSNVSARLKQAATKHNLVVILLAQLNRGVETRDDLTPKSADLKDSGGLEADADIVLLPYLPSMFDAEYKFPNEYRIICSKNRNRPGRGKVIEMLADFKRQRILPPSASDGRVYTDSDADRFWK